MIKHVKLRCLLFYNRCENLNCIDLKYVHPDISKDLFLNCHKLKHINLQTNDFSLDQILDIEEQLLSPLNNISYLKIDEESLECPVCKEGREHYCNCSNCTTVAKLSNLFNIATHNDIRCRLDGLDAESVHDTKKYFVDASKNCKACHKKEANQFAIISVGIIAGKVQLISKHFRNIDDNMIVHSMKERNYIF